MRQNLTFAIESDLLKQVKLFALQKGTSVSQLIRNQLKKLLLEESHYEQAHRQAIRNMKKGAKLGGGPYYKNREELYE